MAVIKEFRKTYTLSVGSSLEYQDFPIYASRLRSVLTRMEEWRPQNYRELAIQPYQNPMEYHTFWFSGYLAIFTILSLATSIAQTYAQFKSNASSWRHFIWTPFHAIIIRNLSKARSPKQVIYEQHIVLSQERDFMETDEKACIIALNINNGYLWSWKKKLISFEFLMMGSPSSASSIPNWIDRCDYGPATVELIEAFRHSRCKWLQKQVVATKSRAIPLRRTF